MLISSITGSSLKHIFLAYLQRLANLHPDGGSIGDGTSPFKIILFLALDALGSGIGMADNKALVYGCSGCSYTSYEVPFSTSFPKYITPI